MFALEPCMNSDFSDLLQHSPLTWRSSKVCCTGCQGTKARLVSIPSSLLMGLLHGINVSVEGNYR
jgi:hypothetical protein